MKSTFFEIKFSKHGSDEKVPNFGDNQHFTVSLYATRYIDKRNLIFFNRTHSISLHTFFSPEFRKFTFSYYLTMDIFELSMMFIFLLSSVVAIEKHNELKNSNHMNEVFEDFTERHVFQIDKLNEYL
ncbi:19122_t:CDS:2 [Cetraspora pellucida]|uniref:19122_t:CDS:1 n=1 Tax=Cetraspora pellucida TaxID=1433469 RepID=A0A9N9CGL8_9GLOM|nr:19122_t:CDS:2 [Cetraspora pellucida]